MKKSGQEGPDFGFIHQGRRIWVEAITPGPVGIPPECLQPPPRNPSEVRAIKVPHEQKLLRWTAALKEKKNKIAEYLEKGVISETDCAVIAINSCRLQFFAFEDLGISGYPYAVEATLPIGPRAIPLSREGKTSGPAQNLWRVSIPNKNRSEVPTDNFLNHDYSFISAVLGTHQRDLWSGSLQLSLVHNPLATNQLHRLLMGATAEYVCTLGDEELTLFNLSEVDEA